MKQTNMSRLMALAVGLLLVPVAAVATHDHDEDPTLDRVESAEPERTELEAAKENRAAVTNPDFSRTVERVPTSWAPPAGSLDDEPQGVLSGRIIYLMPGHGWEYSSGAYRTQRGVNNNMVEDMGNLDQTTLMAQYLLNAGATVAPMRPIGHQANEVVIDNDDPQVTFSGAWSNSSQTIFYGDAGDVPYRFSSVTTGAPTATARYDATIPEEGFYPVYAFVFAGSDRINQQYLIGHSGGVTSRRVNHRMVGTGWVYLGSFHFEAGGQAYVEITNSAEAGETGSNVIADAIRFGNGMGDVILDGAPSVSGKPREEEHGQYWAIESSGNQGSSFTGLGSVSAPRELAQLMNRESEGAQTDRMYLSFHSNAGGGRGADGLYNSDAGSPTTPNGNNWNNGNPSTGDDLAQILGDSINTFMTSLSAHPNDPLDANWGNSGGGNETYASGQSGFSAYGEINYSLNPEMPQTIIETAFHDSADDALIMLDPKGRDLIAQATFLGVVEFFNTYGGGGTAILPAPPEDAWVEQNGSTVTLNWTPPVAGGDFGLFGDAPTGHKIYISENGYGFALAQTVASGAANSADVTALVPVGETRYFRVTATNAGGESFPTGTVAVRRSGSGAKVLIVNGFDRYTRTQDYVQTEPIPGTFRRVFPRYNNSFDYPVTYARALSSAAVHGIDTAQNDQIISGAVSLGDYETVYWILGEESTVDETFSATEQGLVETYVAGGGNLFVSGAEIAWDLGWVASEAGDEGFLNTTLRVATPGNGTTDDDADTYTAQGVSSTSGLFLGQTVSFSDGSDRQLFDVDFPDVMRPSGGSETVLQYVGGAGNGQSAAIAHEGTGGRGNVIVMGFPFEAITSESQRAALLTDTVGFLGATTVIPDWWLLH